MSWIKVVPPGEGDERLQASYEKLGKGPVAHIVQAHSLNPESMDAHLGYYKTIMYGKSPLSRKEREMVATTVSGINGCHY